MTTLRAAMASDPGRVRSVNEDRAVVADGFLAVADGMGGHVGGEVAARLAVESIERAYEERPTADGLVGAVKRANSDVFRHGEKDRALRGMGTTLTAAALIDGPKGPAVAVINVGDSRAYMFSDGKLRRLTEDHSLVEEMVRRGELSEEAALVHPHRHILTRVIGVESDVDVDEWTIGVHDGDRVLLCSDGLTNECTDEEIESILRERADPQAAVKALVDRAIKNGGSDNVTVIVANIEGAPAAAASVAAAPTAAAPPRQASSAAPSALMRSSIVTPLSVLFVLLFLGVLGAVAGFVGWYVRASYFVGLHGTKVAIYEGRPGGFLWFQPTVAKLTSLDESSVYPPSLPFVRAGLLEPSYQAAVNAVSTLSHEQSLFGIATSSLPTATTAASTTTTAASTTATKARG